MKAFQAAFCAALILLPLAADARGHGGGHRSGGGHYGGGGHRSSGHRLSYGGHRGSGNHHGGGGHRSSGGAFRYSGSGRESHDVEHVNGYTTRNGTHVNAYDRTRPNGTRADNWSTKGNVNPETGKPGSKPQ